MAHHYISRHHDAAPEGTEGDVVRLSTGIGKGLQARLESFSHCKHPVDAGITGPQYAYRLIQDEGTAYHVLSRVRHIGVPGTSGPDTVAHHILLTETDVVGLKNKRPGTTPAGLMLALEECGVWGTEAATLHLPELTIPGGSGQATWKRLTGSAETATLLYTEPYNGKCLIQVPSPTEAQDVLRLLHESDRPTPAHGWGRTFTTYGCKEDDPEATARIAIPLGSFLPVEEGWEDTPALCINDRLRVESPYGDIPKMVPRKPGKPDRERVHPPHPVPYCYEEVPDFRMFNIPMRRISPLLRGGVIIILLVLLAVVHALTREPARGHSSWETPLTTAHKHAHPGKRAKNVPVEKTVIHNGFPVTPELRASVAQGTPTAIIIPLAGQRESAKGKVSVISVRGDVTAFHVEGADDGDHTVHALWGDGTLKDVRCNGEQVALILRHHDRAFLLLPPIRFQLPARPKTSLPDAGFAITPADLTLYNGKLGSNKLPDVKEHAYVPWPEPPAITLPSPPPCTHTVTCITEGDVPFEAEVRPTKKKGGMQEFAVRLKLYNPMRHHVAEDFKAIVETPCSQASPGSTISHIYEIAKTFESGYKSIALQEEYSNLQEVFLRHIVLPAYDGSAERPAEIIEALCDKINSELTRHADFHREEAEAYNEPLMLELRAVHYNDNGGGMHWTFALLPANNTPAP